MLKLLESLISISRENNIKIIIHFVKCKGKLYIDKELKAMDEYGNIAPWNRAFPGIHIQNILDQCRVKKVEVYKGSELVLETGDMSEVLSRFRRGF
jgi:hypothetical protein|nr:MAG: hypothetical protein TU35_00285 [Thermoproteus sp. AZ2]